MARDVSNLLHSSFAIPASQMGSRSWKPPVDIYRVPGGWLLKFELAGVASEDVSTTVLGPRVIVRGVRLDRCFEAGCSLHRMEIAYNLFERTVELPEDLSGAALSSEYSNGMLLLKITLGSAS